MLRQFTFLVFAVCLTVGTAGATNLLTNGNFENGTTGRTTWNWGLEYGPDFVWEPAGNVLEFHEKSPFSDCPGFPPYRHYRTISLRFFPVAPSVTDNRRYNISGGERRCNDKN